MPDFKSTLDDNFAKYIQSSPTYTGSNDYVASLAASGASYNPSNYLSWGYQQDMPYTNNSIGKNYTSGVTTPATNLDLVKPSNNTTFPSYLNGEKRWNYDNPGAGNGNKEGTGLLDLLKGDNLKGLGTLGSIGFGLWNAYMGYQNYKENKKSAEQARRFNEEHQQKWREDVAREKQNRASISASWNR